MSLATIIARVLESDLGRQEGSIPERLSVSDVAALFGVSHGAVHHAVKIGKLPAEAIRDPRGGVVAYTIRLDHAYGIWGHKIVRKRRADA